MLALAAFPNIQLHTLVSSTWRSDANSNLFLILLKSVGPYHHASGPAIYSPPRHYFFLSPKTHDVKRRINCHWLDAVPLYAAQISIPSPQSRSGLAPMTTTRHDQRTVVPERRIISILLFFYARFPENDEETGIISNTTCRCVFAVGLFLMVENWEKVCLRSAAIERPSRKEHVESHARRLPARGRETAPSASQG